MALSEAQARRAESAPGTALAIEALMPADVEGGLALSDAAGWNQTADDWALFIRRGRALGCRDAAGRLVATAASLPYGAEAGWISMVLVEGSQRHRGLASALVRESIAHLHAAGASPYLDATPAGAAVYRSLGFAGGSGFERWQAAGPLELATAPFGVRRADATDHDRIAALDRSAAGLDRCFLLEDFLSRPGTRAWLPADGLGFIMTREGRRATQIGPLVAAQHEAAIALLATSLATLKSPVFIDVPTARGEIAAWLEGHGFQRQRSFVRMSLGTAQPPAISELGFALAGPEFG